MTDVLTAIVGVIGLVLVELLRRTARANRDDHGAVSADLAELKKDIGGMRAELRAAREDDAQTRRDLGEVRSAVDDLRQDMHDHITERKTA